MRSWISAFLLCAASVAPLFPAQAEELTIAAGAGYRRPIAEIAAAFESKSGHKVLQTYGHMGQVIAQSREAGRIAVVCGDRVVLEAAPGLVFHRMHPLGTGRLVVAWRKGLQLGSPEAIVAPEFKRIALADQVNAVFGKAARQYLDRAGLYGAIESRIMSVPTVPQVTTYLASGEVDVGYINATDAIGAAQHLGGYVEIAQNFYDRIEIACGVLGSAAGSAAVSSFAEYLASQPAQDVLRRYGL